MFILDKPEYFGQLLHKRGFKDWFIYMFHLIEGHKFGVEKLHEAMFKKYQAIFDMKELRLNVNVPPRSAKTTFNKYFVAYTLAINPRAEFIYTSFSQDLLGDISRQIQSILNHPIYRKMYSLDETTIEEIKANPINEFWKNYLEENQGKEHFSNKKIITSSGGIVYFPSMGSSITGFGCGSRNARKFSGCLIIDDGNKPSDIRSQVIRQRVQTYYDETLLSRLNDSQTAIINVQQRLHEDDLTGYLIRQYGYKTFKMPLIDNQGKCCLPSQYTDERVKELQKNNYLFSAQYQQEPVKLGGNIIKSIWFKYFSYNFLNNEMRYFMTADTAQKKNEWNDYSVLCCWATDRCNLYLVDMLRGKWEAPELRKLTTSFWNKHQSQNPNAFYIEDKSSGTGLIQDLQRDTAIPVIPVQREKDKLTRVEDILTYIEAGRIYLPDYESFVQDFIDECESFTRDMTHSHDDIVDNLCDAVVKGLSAGSVSTFDVL